MNSINTILSIEEAHKKKKRYVRSLEYEVIANLVLQQYIKDGHPLFEDLLSIPLPERIPGLLQDYGLKRMHRLIKLVLQEFCYASALPRSRKLTDTKTSVCSCDLLLAAEEDQLSLEDLIVFFELAKEGKFGKLKSAITHYAIMQMLEKFRQQRYDAYSHAKEQKQKERKALGPVERTSPEPTAIKHLFENPEQMFPLKKIS